MPRKCHRADCLIAVSRQTQLFDFDFGVSGQRHEHAGDEQQVQAGVGRRGDLFARMHPGALR